MNTKLTLGPILFNWSPEKKRDFYFKIADETSINTVYLGEVVCSKRLPFFMPFLNEIIERLKISGKEVVFSTYALLCNEREYEQQVNIIQEIGVLAEANDTAFIELLSGKPFCLGPYINIYNEKTLEYFAKQNAIRATLPPELPASSIETLAKTQLMELEVQVFGRMPLAISARCSHARSYSLHKQDCQYICYKDSNGLDVFTLEKQPFLAVNGLQTMSYSYCNLLSELVALQTMGVSGFRLSPHDTDMVSIIDIFQKTLNEKCSIEEAHAKLSTLMPDVTFSNGFYNNQPGFEYNQSEELL